MHDREAAKSAAKSPEEHISEDRRKMERLRLLTKKDSAATTGGLPRREISSLTAP
jgi:hypothetical protein